MKLKKHPAALLQRTLVYASAVLVFGVLLALIVYILVMGVPNLKLSLFAWHYNSENLSMLPAILNTLTMIALTLLLAVPFGIGAAIYLVEYAGRGNRLVKLVRLTAETLSGIPSIVYGLFGYLMFVLACGMGNSMLAGALTLAIMVLPTILRTTEEALRAVPDLPRGQLRSGRGKAPHGHAHRPARRRAGYFFGHRAGDRQGCGRDSGADLHGGDSYRRCRRAARLGADAGDPSVLSAQ